MSDDRPMLNPATSEVVYDDDGAAHISVTIPPSPNQSAPGYSADDEALGVVPSDHWESSPTRAAWFSRYESLMAEMQKTSGATSGVLGIGFRRMDHGEFRTELNALAALGRIPGFRA